ncbi:MAG: hypothetical protein LC624_09680 [Halobacteriales archaeon]|nr:hypothetical protein [Halobacteriales archaeon]
MRAFLLLIPALLLPGCAAPPEPDLLLLPSGQPCPVPPPLEQDASPSRIAWRAAGCILGEDPVAHEVIGDDGFGFALPAGVRHLRSIFHLDGREPLQVELRLAGAVIARAHAGANSTDTIVVQDLDAPAAGNWTLRAKLEPPVALQGWWAAVEARLGP